SPVRRAKAFHTPLTLEERLEQARELLKPYTHELPEVVVKVLTEAQPFSQWPADVLEAVLWSMPQNVFCRLFNTHNAKLRQMLKQDQLGPIPDRSLWPAIRAGQIAYPNGVAPGMAGLTPDQRRLMSKAQALLRGY